MNTSTPTTPIRAAARTGPRSNATPGRTVLPFRTGGDAVAPAAVADPGSAEPGSAEPGSAQRGSDGPPLPSPEPIRLHRLRDAYGALTNLAPYPVILDGIVYPSAEHAFQAAKFPGAPEHQARIRAARSAYQALALGCDRAQPLREDWDTQRIHVMYDVLLAKFIQNPRPRAQLLATGHAPLIQAGARDRFWAAGDGTGLNLLGRLLMEIRDLLRAPDRLRGMAYVAELLPEHLASRRWVLTAASDLVVLPTSRRARQMPSAGDPTSAATGAAAARLRSAPAVAALCALRAAQATDGLTPVTDSGVRIGSGGRGSAIIFIPGRPPDPEHHSSTAPVTLASLLAVPAHQTIAHVHDPRWPDALAHHEHGSAPCSPRAPRRSSTEPRA